MDWSIQEIARLAGTTSRTLRHYDNIGLLSPSRVGHNRYRYYDQRALVKLQRILLLRELGLRLPDISQVISGQTKETTALTQHLAWLHAEQDRITRQINSLSKTISAIASADEKGDINIMAEDMFDGFDHTQYQEEVTQRWGAAAYKTSDTWWRSLGEAGRREWKDRAASLQQDWIALASSAVTPTSPQAQELAARHVAWLTEIPGTPSYGQKAETADVRAYVMGLGEMYVTDPRFAANYGGQSGAIFVRDALTVFVSSMK